MLEQQKQLAKQKKQNKTKTQTAGTEDGNLYTSHTA